MPAGAALQLGCNRSRVGSGIVPFCQHSGGTVERPRLMASDLRDLLQRTERKGSLSSTSEIASSLRRSLNLRRWLKQFLKG